MIQSDQPLPVTRRCELLKVARSTAYCRPGPVSHKDLVLMRLIDEIHLETTPRGRPWTVTQKQPAIPCVASVSRSRGRFSGKNRPTTTRTPQKSPWAQAFVRRLG